jgi:hypothetical protein
MFSTSGSYPGIPELPPEESLIRTTVNQRSPRAFKQPRKRPDFNQKVDDDAMLPRITSMMILPVKNTPFVVALYNSTVASEFTPIQISVAEIFGLSLPPILKQISMSQEMASLGKAHAQGIASAEATVRLIPELVQAINSDRLFELLNQRLRVKSFLFYLVSRDRAVRYPDGCLVELSGTLRLKSDEPYITSDLDLAVDIAGNSSLKIARVIRRGDSICLFAANNFSGVDETELDQLGGVLVFFIPLLHLRRSLDAAFRGQQDIRSCGRGDITGLSRLLTIPVKCEFHSPPLKKEPDSDALVQVCVETEKGIEAVITAEAQADGIIEFGGVLSAGLNHRPETTPLAALTDFFISHSLIEVFRCTRETVGKWLSRLSSMVTFSRPEPFEFLVVSLEGAPWSDWFDATARLLILLASFLRGIERKWQCQVSEAMVERAKDAPSTTCPILAAVFSPGFGLADRLDEEITLKLMGELQTFIVPTSAEAEGRVVARVTHLAASFFRQSPENRAWLAQAFVLLPRVYQLTVESDTLPQRLMELYGERGRIAELIRAERVYSPILLSLSRREDRFLKMSPVIRDAITHARKATRE